MDRPLDFEATQQRRENQFAAATKSAEIALQSLLILNGGAAVALLSVVAALSASREADKLAPIIESATYILRFFAAGAGSAVIAAIAAYICNYCYAEAILAPKPLWRKCAIGFHAGSLTACLLSIFLFCAGVWSM
jgi:hypothetical protein